MISLTPGARRRSLAGTLILLLSPGAFAAEGDNVRLAFAGSDLPILFAAIAAGLAALAYAFLLIRSLLAQSTGDDRMREVGAAIKTGALAYLRKQIGAMLPFVAVLAVGLFFLYGLTPTAFGVALCFVLGVLGSYTAGYTGMIAAVNGNMRVAAAAQKSYKLALETAFRSGAVAGLVTVGIGLIGAALILVLGGAEAVKLLIGFGFGGSLAALFMRVGGGIFTKAADVGADLVGKVEAGIPEDDPRNPAVIADNVGDNVGDCAGMAADVFESYEVTLIAAIVLAAATSVVLDRETWTRLVLFAFAIAGIGAIASVVGISLVRGTDDLDKDPLVPIRKGFFISAALSLLGIGVASYALLGGANRPIMATQLVSPRTIEQREADFFRDLTKKLASRPVSKVTVDAGIKAARKNNRAATTAELIYGDPAALPKELFGIPQVVVDRVLKNDPSPVREYEITAADLANTPEAKARGYKSEDAGIISQTIAPDPKTIIPDYRGFSRVVDNKDKENPTLQLAVTAPPIPGWPSNKRFTTLGDAYGRRGQGTKLADDQLVVMQVRIVADLPPQPSQPGQPAPPTKIDRTQWIGPAYKGALDKQIKDQRATIKAQGLKAEFIVKRTVPAELYTHPDGRAILTVPSDVENPQLLRSTFPLSYFDADVATLEKISQPPAPGETPRPTPPAKTIDIVVAKATPVPWWGFFACFATGIALALAIEKLTEYYVSTGKKPTREVAGVSTAGAAPMLIQGFAYGAESAAAMVGLILLALLVPLMVFPAALFGTAIISLYGVALVGLGLLATTAYVLAMDTFGPISDNAQGVFEMSGAAKTDPKGALAVSRLDAAGNTTKALTKGFAIATAVVAAIALFQSYVEGARLGDVGLRLDVPEIFLGLLIGGAAPFLFSAFAINAVGRSSFELITEVRRQFLEDPGIMKGTSKPDYARCVAIVTAAAQRELLGPGILAIALPVAVGFGFSIGKAPTIIGGQAYNLTGAQALGGFLAGAITSGVLMAVLLANSGGMWDNAKKLIEDGLFGGKGSDAHKASVICDTVGDPFKDTAGPALNPLIKVMNLVALLLSGVIILPLPNTTLIVVTLVAVALLAFAIYRSKKGSLSEGFQAAQGTAPAVQAASEVTPGDVPSGDAPKPPKKKLRVEE